MHVVARAGASFLSVAASCSIVLTIPHFVSPFICWNNFNGFHLLTIVFLWTFVLASTLTFKSLGCISGSEIAGSYGNTGFNLFEKLLNLQLVLSCLAQALPSQLILTSNLVGLCEVLIILPPPEPLLFTWALPALPGLWALAGSLGASPQSALPSLGIQASLSK